MSRVLVPLAPGFEEIEAVTLVDLLRRAGIEVHTAALADREVTGSHGITVTADMGLDDACAGDYDMIALPGGMPGAEHLKKDARIAGIIQQLHAKGRPVAAICAAPRPWNCGLAENTAASR